MKPMTVEQERAMTKYKINHDELNEHNLKIWRQLYTDTQFAISMLRDHFRKGKHNADT